jgi:zinc and cadmium transporter
MDGERVIWLIVCSLIGGVGAVVLSGGLLVVPEAQRARLVPRLVSYAAGSLLGASLLGLLPHALDGAPPRRVLGTVVAGIVLFFALERLLIWRHCHEVDCEEHRAAGALLLVGDAFHNFTDGVILAAAFLTSIPLGLAATLAIVAHEIPQELGDFAILLESGYPRRQAFAWNTLAATTTLPGAIAGYLFLAQLRSAAPYVMALSVASFLYIAMADLVPHLHRRGRDLGFASQLALMLAGIATILLIRRITA